MTLLQSCACGIDVHAHVVPEHFPAYLKGAPPADWPSTAPAHECLRHVMVKGRVYRTVSDRCWSAPKRIADMNGMRVRVQALSPMPELLSTWMEAEPAAELLRYINDQIAAFVDEGAGRFVGLGAVPLQDLDLAIAEMRRVVSELGFAGVEIGSNINGRPIGAPELEPFFEAAEELGAAIFVHALRPAGMDRLVGPAQLQQVLAYPTDVGLAAASVITSNLVVRHPRLRIAFSHGGGTLRMLLPRLEEGWKVFPALQESISESPLSQARKLFADTLVYDGSTLRCLLGIFGETQLMLGTDYPFNFHERHPVERVEAAFSDQDLRDRLIYGNAAAFLGVH